MKYKIVSYQGEKFYFENKEELFKTFDDLLNPYYYWCGTLRNKFTEEGFEFSEQQGNFVVDKKESHVYNKYSEKFVVSFINIKVNALYKIYTEKNVVVNLEEILSEYKQSRGVKQRVYKPYYCDRSTQKYRKRWKSYAKEGSNAFRKEYRNNIYASEEGVKVRASRAHEVKMKHVCEYDDCFIYRDAKRSWKDYKKNRKQWMKNQSKL